MALSEHPMVTPLAGDDLSALAWVQVELGRLLALAHKALRLHLQQQTELAELDIPDPAVLRQARSQLHQAVGVLELVGLGRAAELIRAAEAVLQRLSDRPRLITPLVVQKIEHGSFALLDFIAQRLAGRSVSTVALFPPYRALQELAGIARAHPADLWTFEWSWCALVFDRDVPPRRLDEDAVHRIEADLLDWMRGAAPDSAARLSELLAGLAVAALAPGDDAMAPNRRLATLWQLAAGFFEALAGGWIQPDVHSKRIGSRLLAQLRVGEQAQPSERLARDLLFFCSQVVRPEVLPAGSRLAAIRHGYGLTAHAAVDYEQDRLGCFDSDPDPDPDPGNLAAVAAHRCIGLASADLDGARVNEGGFEPALGFDLSTDLQADLEMRQAFVDEAREMIHAVRQALDVLGTQADDSAALQGLRHAFHSLKASARVVGLDALARVARACEQLLNLRLGEPVVRAEPALQVFIHQACDAVDAWVQALSAGEASHFHAEALVAAADALASPQVPVTGADLTAEPWLDGLAPAHPPAPRLPGLQSLLDHVPDLPLASDLDLWGSLPEAMAPGPRWQPAAEGAAPTDPAPDIEAPHDSLQIGASRAIPPGLERWLDTANMAGQFGAVQSQIASDVGLLKGGLGEVSENLERFQARLRDIEWQTHTAIGSEIDSRADTGQPASPDFDLLARDRDRRLKAITRSVAGSVADLAALQLGLQRTLQATEDLLAQQVGMARLAREQSDDDPQAALTTA